MQAFGQIHQVVEFGVGDFRLDHPELGEVAARLRFFRAEGWAERIHLAQRHGRGFDIELARLRQIRLLVEVIDRETAWWCLRSGGRENRRIGQGESALVEEIARGLDDLGAHPQDRRLPLRAHPEMAVLHQKVDAVFFRRDRIGIVFGDALHDLDVGDVEFISAGRALVGADFAFDDDAGFLREAFDGVEDFGRNGVLRNDALNHARCRRGKCGNSSLPLSRRL